MKTECVTWDTKAFVWINTLKGVSDNEQRMAILTRGCEDFPCHLVSFITVHGGNYSNHPVKTFMNEVEATRAARRFVETGEG